MRGEVVSYFLFDLGSALDLSVLQKQAVGKPALKAPEVRKATPQYVEFPRPVGFGGASLPVAGPWGRADASVRFHFFPLGVVSVRFRVKVDVATLKGLQGWDKTTATLDGKNVPLPEAARILMEKERPTWETAVRERYTTNVLSESYTVFAFSDVGEPAAGFLKAHRAEIAGLLAGEDGQRLHAQEVEEALAHTFSYYTDDLVVIDWDAALIIDPTPAYDDILFVFEIANLQLLEFRAYDDYLDDVIQRAYDELEKLYRRPWLFRSARRTAHSLSLLRMEIAEFADEADNITKFLGDWFLARVYEATQKKIHLGEWRAAVDDKLDVLQGLYQLANEEGDARRNLVLEVLIVLLFVLDLIIIVLLP